ncbi:MAG: 2-C-methyl-D-erythritol 4-phosphate cytidylyltransferase [Candidatus Omnitrophica bacterium]|nr:2-C-methyl-D-erythritol 4-phosphate cytidylyltransferase [Candidatus Omnitrophota bacterium]
MIGVVIAGGGKGTRIGDTPKAFLKISRKQLLYYSIEKFYKKSDEIVVVLPSGYAEQWRKKLKVSYEKIEVISGGEHRQDSVKAGLSVLKKSEIIIVHDVARPFFSDELLNRVIKGAERYGAAVPYIEPRDTIKERDGQFIKKTLNRDNIIYIQTPQAFKAEIIREAYYKAYKENFYATDDAALVENLGAKVYLVEGERENIKITYPLDIEIAKEIIKNGKRRCNIP